VPPIDRTGLRCDAVEVKDWDGREPSAERQTNVNDDLRLIVSYAESCPDEFGGSWLEADGRYGVTFICSLDTHTRLLEEVLVYPERLRARQAAHSLKELQAICDQIRHEHFTPAGTQDSIGAGLLGWSADQKRGIVKVKVVADRPDVLSEQFGPLGEIKLSNGKNTPA
jgi:hypothetical protein